MEQFLRSSINPMIESPKNRLIAVNRSPALTGEYVRKEISSFIFKILHKLYITVDIYMNRGEWGGILFVRKTEPSSEEFVR